MYGLEKYLRDSIADNTSVSDMISIFEKGCQPMDEEDLLLFETGTFEFTGEPLFYFSLVKQIENDDDEYIQTHLDVLFKPDDTNKAFNEELWSDESDSFFNSIKSSDAFNYAKNNSFCKIDIYTDET